MRSSGIVVAVCLGVMALGGGTAGAVEIPIANDKHCAAQPLLHPHDFPVRALQNHPHPPVILVHGTGGPEATMLPLAAALKAAGYCPWTLSYPTSMAADGDAPAAISSFVNTVRSLTGAASVSMVGHSQGGMQIRHTLLHNAGLPVEDAISLAGTQKGSAHPVGKELCKPTGPCPPGFNEQLATAPIYDELNGTACSVGGELDDMNCMATTWGGADYTNITTITDELVFPYWRALMGPYPSTPLSQRHARVEDVVLQVYCPAAQTDHMGIVADPHAFAVILDALGRPGPADPLPCAPKPAVAVG
jgi:triacylglycerol lipase